MTFTNTSIISIIFEVINIRNNQINVNKISDTPIFIIIGSIIMVWFFIAHINTVCETSKQLRKIAIIEQEQLQLAMKITAICQIVIVATMPIALKICCIQLKQ